MASEHWQRNLFAIFISEFLVMVGFNFVTPFMPFFIQDLGKFTDREAALWAGIATGSSGIAMFFSAPVWGILSDRWGRKPMVLRAQFGSAITLALTGLVPNIYLLVILRFIQGTLSGTVAAASALVSADTPRHKMPFAMGLLMGGIFGGTALGPLLGGLMADAVGYKAAFFITSGLLILGGLIVVVFVKEKFERPTEPRVVSPRSILRLAGSKQILPLLLIVGSVHAGPQIISPIIPLFIRSVDTGHMAASTSGLAFCFMGIVASLSAVVTSRLGARVSLKKILVISCLGTGLLYFPPMLASTSTQLIIFIALTGLMKGGFMTSANSLVGLSVSPGEQGAAYGIAQSASALGNGLGPFIGGSLASVMGIQPVFGITGAIHILVGILVSRILVEQRTGSP